MSEECPCFASDHWTDGFIWGCGAKYSLHSVRLAISDLPCSLIDSLITKLEDMGFETQLLEMPNFLTKQTDLKLEMVSQDPIFDNLPKFRLRRILPTHPELFIDGFLLSRLFSARKRSKVGEDGFSFDFIRLRVRCDENVSNIMKILMRRGVQYEEAKGRGVLEINAASFDVEPFATYVSAMKREYEQFGGELEDGEQLIEDMEREILERKERTSNKVEGALIERGSEAIVHPALSEDELSLLKYLSKRDRSADDLERFFGRDYENLLRRLRESGVTVNKPWGQRYSLFMERRKCRTCGATFIAIEGFDPKSRDLCDLCSRSVTGVRPDPQLHPYSDFKLNGT